MSSYGEGQMNGETTLSEDQLHALAKGMCPFCGSELIQSPLLMRHDIVGFECRKCAIASGEPDSSINMLVPGYHTIVKINEFRKADGLPPFNIGQSTADGHDAAFSAMHRRLYEVNATMVKDLTDILYLTPMQVGRLTQYLNGQTDDVIAKMKGVYGQ